MNDFIEEIILMKAVGSHKNIVSLIGCCTKSTPNFLIVEFASKGDLLSYLGERRKKVNALVYPEFKWHDVWILEIFLNMETKKNFTLLQYELQKQAFDFKFQQFVAKYHITHNTRILHIYFKWYNQDRHTAMIRFIAPLQLAPPFE